jgi:cysteine-rich repeat protein
MTDLGFSFRRWIERAPAAPFLACLLSIALGVGASCVGAGCGQGSNSAGNGATSTGAGGMTGSTSDGTTSTTGGLGGLGSAAGGAGGSATGGASSTAGAGGAGGGFVPPVGTAEYPAEKEPNDLVSTANPLAAGTKGFTASIWPIGDIDVFQFDVTVAASGVSVMTSDGKGGCPAGAHTYVRVFDASETVLALADGSAGCASLSSASSPALLALPVGTYYVHVESAELSTIPYYILDIAITAPVCGDGIVQVPAGEQCDLGTANGTGGCSATCQLTSGSYVEETEPNDTAATANDLDGHAGAVGQIYPATDVDWYSVDVTVANSSITAVIGDGLGGCPGNFDSELSLLDSSMTLLASDEGGGVAPCSRISPAQYPAASLLPVGKYFLEVQRVSTQTQPSYVLTVTVTPPGCGDGIVEPGEQCDPGATPVAGCSATCQLTGDFIAETEPNGTLAQANPLGTHAGFIASINPVGDQDYFSFQVPGPSSLVSLQTSDGIGGCPLGFASVLYLYGPSHTLIVSDQNSGVGQCSRISPLLDGQASNLTAGTYYARVERSGDMATQQEYVLAISVQQPGCGNGFIEAGEQCDDGAANGTPGDGCSATCQSLAPWEVEPNGTTGQATPLWSGYSTWKGAISPVGDHDYYAFTLAAAGTVTLTTHDVDLPATCSSDTLLYLLAGDGTTQLAFDDDSGPGPGDPKTGGRCSKIALKALAAGNYYAWVQGYMDKELIPGYQLDLLVQ